MPNAPQAFVGTQSADLWPPLPAEDWRETYATLHMWTQIVGKVRLALTPLINHFWNVTLHLTPRGLTTGAMPVGNRHLEIRFDLVDHHLIFTTSDGLLKFLPLIPQSVADFYRDFMTTLKALEADVRIWPVPVEVADPIPFAQDQKHAAYDAKSVSRWWQALQQTEQVFQEFRARFIGKCSPVHFFWGSFDLAVTRFSGRRAPDRPGVDRVQREAYSHECISHGFWPGGSWFGSEVPAPVFYSYTAPEPPGLRDQPIRPAIAHFDPKLSEFILPYDDFRQASSPRDTLMEFLQSTYEAGAKRAGWNRAELEREGKT
jgi:hypothetical protein